MGVKQMKERAMGLLKQARDLSAEVEAEGRDFTGEERAKVKALIDEVGELKGKIKEAEGDAGLADAIKSLGEDFAAPDKPELDRVKAGRKGSLGERFVGSDGFKSFMDQFPNGRIPDSTKGITSAPVHFKDLLTGVADDSAGALVETDYTRIYEGLGRRPLSLLDLISKRTTGSDTVHFVRQLTQSNAAAAVAEATTAEVVDGVTITAADGGVKPEGSFTLDPVTENVKTVAVWIPATKRALSDASQLKGLIDDELMSDLWQETEDLVANGDGTGENFTGILQTSGIQTQAWDTDLFTTTRKGRTKVRTVGRARASAYLFHPNDWETIDLTQDLEGRYYYGGPAGMGPESHWKIPVVQSEAIPEGTGIVGDFSKAVMWNREQATIQVSDSHADFFVRNLIAVLAEHRAAFAVTRPAAFVSLDLTA